MQHDLNTTPKHPENPEQSPQHSRRKFLTRATAGVVIASLPAKSVWAAGGNILNSIVASGHGSDFANGKRIQLLSQGLVKTHLPEYHRVNFISIFGGAPFLKKGTLGQTVSEPLGLTLTFGEILNSAGGSIGGPDNVNLHMIALYIAADQTDLNPNNRYNLYYPVVGTGKFGSAKAFAMHLYEAVKNGSITGKKLDDIINCYHVGKSGTGSCGIL